MKLRIPKGYTPSTYEQLAELAGLPVSEARRCADEMAAAGIVSLIKHGDDPRIKRCEVCGYPFRDKTRPGNAKVCGDTCKTTRKTVQRAEQRKVKPARGVTVKPNKQIRYVWWLEYPYWVTEKWMLNHVGSYERPRDPDKLAYIIAAKERAERMGGRKKVSG
ncbi:hypothetical protein ACL02P_12750 [Paenibacillus sp. MB22_1]|uniref:hypothetical protein n=1 Tax=Paenibacillus sp. MB22_1 TaxID=3383121 RepID=UPI00399F57D7